MPSISWRRPSLPSTLALPAALVPPRAWAARPEAAENEEPEHPPQQPRRPERDCGHDQRHYQHGQEQQEKRYSRRGSRGPAGGRQSLSGWAGRIAEQRLKIGLESCLHGLVDSLGDLIPGEAPRRKMVAERRDCTIPFRIPDPYGAGWSRPGSERRSRRRPRPYLVDG